jgi:nucleoid-associated protein YgaU
VVVKGDTLWDIAEAYVKDPFRYPELAELSKIKNPDLIYPYDLVRIHIYE